MPYSDPAKLKARNRAYYLKHRDEIIAHVRNYVELNRDKVASCQRQKYLRNKNQISKKSKEVETIQPIHKKYRPNDRHYDHVVPLIRGGKHSMDNMRILCASCNTSKQHRLDSELPLSFGVKKHVA